MVLFLLVGYVYEFKSRICFYLHLLSCPWSCKHGPHSADEPHTLKQPSPVPHCQTFENRSSFPPSPAAGLDVLPVLAVVVLLVQPPNSSSAVTLGANPPDAPGTMGWLANEAQPISFETAEVAGFDGCAAGLGASGLAHALPPQTSEPDQLLPPIEPRGFELVADGAGGEAFC